MKRSSLRNGSADGQRAPAGGRAQFVFHGQDLGPNSSNAPAPRCQATSLKAPGAQARTDCTLPDCRGLRRRTPLTSGGCHGLG